MQREQIIAGRLTLRPFTKDDISWVYDISQDAILQRFVSVPSPYRREDAAYFVEQVAIAGWESGQRAEFVVQDTNMRRRVGRVGLGFQSDGTAEIGFWVDPTARNCGVATDAVRAACRWAFTTTNVQLIEWRAEVGNVASERVAEKAGFRIEATLRQRLIHRGTRVDARVGSLLREESA